MGPSPSGQANWASGWTVYGRSKRWPKLWIRLEGPGNDDLASDDVGMRHDVAADAECFACVSADAKFVGSTR